MNEQTLQPEMKFENLPDILTIQQTRTILGIGRTAVYRLVENGEIHCFKIGNAYKIPKASVMEFIQRCTEKGGVQV